MANRPHVRTLVPRFAAYHAREPSWGVLHAVMDDGNFDDASVAACLASPAEDDQEGVELALALQAMRPSGRRRLAAAVAERERSVVILRPDGIRATEAEGMEQADLSDFVVLVNERWPEKTPGERERQARIMYTRHPLIERAYRKGLEQGRDVRERLRRGMGLWWDALEPLTPAERGFVVERVKAEVVGVRA